MISLATTMAVARGLHLAAILSLLGAIGFITWMLPAAIIVPYPLRVKLTRLASTSGLIALLAGITWFILQAATISDADNLSQLFAALPMVALHTRYGNIMMARLGLLLLAILVIWLGCNNVFQDVSALSAQDLQRERYRSKRVLVSLYLTFGLTIIALGLEGWIGHAGATGGAIGDGLVLSECLHLLAAGVWLGALLPLWMSLLVLPPAQAALVCERFSPIGLACVLILAGTGFVQGLQLIGSFPALFGTTYGHIALLKIALFLLALMLAAINRLWLTDRLGAEAASAGRDLRISICLETCVGLAIVIAAAFMASSPPAAHTTPVWPFSWQFSLVTVNEDPEFRRDVIITLVAIGSAITLMVGTLLWRRLRLLALVVLIATIAVRGSSLTLLTIEAYPTSFQTSPTNFSAASIARGQAMFAQNCVACHGPEGEGNGPAAATLRIKPADLTMPHIWQHTDGEMFWWLTHGIDDPEGGLAMPGFGHALSVDDRWALIDYIRAHNAGRAMQKQPTFDVPVRAPSFPVTCAAGIKASTTADLLGHALHVVAGSAAQINVPPQAGISTINLALRDTAALQPGSCIAATAAAWPAYAILADLPPDELAGAQFLVDPNGWLRAVRRPGTTAAWPTQESLIAAIREICANPIKQSSEGQHEHHH